MASSVYYPRTLTTPQDIANQFCPAGESSEDFRQRILSANSSLTTQSSCAPRKPVMVPSADQSPSVSLGPLNACTAEEQDTLSQLSQYAGGAAVMGTARLFADLRLGDIAGNLTSFGGGGISAGVALANPVLSAIGYYDHANQYYQNLKNHRAAPATLNQAKRVVERAFIKMNHELNARSLNYLNNHAFGMRQTTTVTGRQVWESIPVRESVDVQRLAGFARVGRVVAPGLVLVDGGMRANKVHNAYQGGNPDWKKMAVVEGGSFAMGLGAGVAVGFVLTITPVGLAVAIVAGGAAAVGVDHVLKRFFTAMYDWVFK